MNINDIDDILTGYDRIAEACEDALRADKNLIDEEDRWLPLPYARDFKSLEISLRTGDILGAAQVWTNQTGGSSERMEFRIPLDTLNKFLLED